MATDSDGASIAEDKTNWCGKAALQYCKLFLAYDKETRKGYQVYNVMTSNAAP
jgi:hypothetical protein